MAIELNPKNTGRAMAYEMWINAPLPMVTVFKSIDITRAVKISKKRKVKLNAILSWCVGMSATKLPEAYYLIKDKKLYEYEKIAVDNVVPTKNNGISFCAVPFNQDFNAFYADYLAKNKQVYETCTPINADDEHVSIGISALVKHTLDGVVNMYSDNFCNTMFFWGKYTKKWFRKILPISFQFHHVQMDGEHAMNFIELLQKQVNWFKI